MAGYWSLAMSQYLLTRDFHDFESSNLKTFSKSPEIIEPGYFLECDLLEYPNKIHEKTNFFPFLEKKNN